MNKNFNTYILHVPTGLWVYSVWFKENNTISIVILRDIPIECSRFLSEFVAFKPTDYWAPSSPLTPCSISEFEFIKNPIFEAVI